MSCSASIHRELEGARMFIWNEVVSPDMLNERFFELLRSEGIIK